MQRRPRGARWSLSAIAASSTFGLFLFWFFFVSMDNPGPKSGPPQILNAGDGRSLPTDKEEGEEKEEEEGEVVPLRLLEFSRKVRILVTTVAGNSARVSLLLDRVYANDPLAWDGLFVVLSDVADPRTGAREVPHCNGFRNWLSAKCCRFKHWYEKEWTTQAHSEVVWVVKMDDDTYLNLRNLFETLLEFDPDVPVLVGDRTSWSGRKGKRFSDPLFSDLATSTVWPNGGAGWVLNRAARDVLFEEGATELQCDYVSSDDVAFGAWVQKHNRVKFVPHFGMHQRAAFSARSSDVDGDYLGNLIDRAFFLCVEEEEIHLAYLPIAFHKGMGAFPAIQEAMAKKRFTLVQLEPPTTPLDDTSDHYYARMQKHLESHAPSYTRADCHATFNWTQIASLQHGLP